jgi:hypothetical protein
MTLNATGPLSLGGCTPGQSVNLELGQTGTQTITMDDTNVRALAGVATGQIGFDNLQGKSNAPTGYTLQYLVVAGGGGGWQGSGGGGGGVVCGSLAVAQGTTYTITVGTKGLGNFFSSTGSPSTFSGGDLLVTALGGGGINPANGRGGPGGSGGGGISSTYGTATQPGQSQSVGSCGTYNNRGNRGGIQNGGGGGAGGQGGNGYGPSGLGGAGGAGYTWTYTGATYAGGGGGGGVYGGPGRGGGGGSGGGGSGGPITVPGSGGNATYYGSGGGGWGAGTVPGGSGPYAGGDGYAGVVILAVPTGNYPGSYAPQASTPGSAPGMTVLTYTAPGTYVA